MVLETRVISGEGEILFLGDGDNLVYRSVLYADIVREPSNKYINKNYAPVRSEYARISLMVGEYVIDELAMRYPKQVWQIGIFQSSQNLLSMICMYEGILDSFLELAECISECVPISKTNRIKGHPYDSGIVTGARVKCYADTAIRVTYRTEDLEKCEEEDGDPAEPPLPPPPIENPPAPGEPLEDTPFEASPPYEGREDFTSPLPGDGGLPPSDPGEDDVEPPFGEDCQRVIVTTDITTFDEDGTPTTVRADNIYFAPITGYGYQPGSNPGSRTWGVFCRGSIPGGCGNPGFYSGGELTNDTDGGFVSVVSFEVI